MIKPSIGIMQGRLVPPEGEAIQSFPRQQWQDEFAFAARAGLDCIEWIYDDFGANINPINTEAGLVKIVELSNQHSIKVNSICADYFMEFPLIGASPKQRQERLNRLFWLMERGCALDVNYILLPFVDASRLQSREEIIEISEILNFVLTNSRSLEIHLETSLPPEEFSFLLSLLPSSRIKANYDSGNSASLGYTISDEFAAYGERIGSVHIKDRILNGGTVPLGNGNAEFASLFAELDRYNYSGNLILQVARGIDGEEISWARQNREFVLRCLN